MQDVVSKINHYESGDMSECETIQFFQELVDTGMAWVLQGHYGRVASSFIEEGLVTPPEKETL